MKTKKILLAMLVTLVVTYPALTSWSGPATGEVIVGQISAMTGPTSTTHILCSSGTKDYLLYLNDKFGGIEGKKGKVKIKYLTYDSQYVAAKAKDGFARLLEQGMIVHTHCASGHSDALMQDYESAKIPLVTASHGVASLWSDWAYGNYHSGVANMIRTWIVWTKDRWIKAGKPGGKLILGTITTDEPFIPLCLWEIDSFVKEQDIKLVIETMTRGTIDASPQLLRLKEAGSREIFILSSAPGSVVVLKSAKTMGLNLPITQSEASNPGDIMALGGPDLAEGLQAGYFFEPTVKNPKIPDSAGMKLTKELWAKNHPGEGIRDVIVGGVISGMVIAEGIRLALDEVPPEKLNGEALKISGLDRIRNFDPMGLTMPLSYVPGDHIGPKHEKYWVVRKGYVEPLGDWIPTTLYRIPKK